MVIMSHCKSVSTENGLVNGQVETPSGISRCVEIGKKILVRWAGDSLFYIGTVCKFSNKRTRYYIKYENGLCGWCGAADLQNSLMVARGDIKCSLCQDGVSKSPNEIVLCDMCGLGFHQLCHNPKIAASAITSPDVEWLCRLCNSVRTEKPGSANKPKWTSMSDNILTENSKTIKSAKILKKPKTELVAAGAIVKNCKQNRDPDEIISQSHSRCNGPRTSFPYNLDYLQWDPMHLVNSKKMYCYCGGRGDWFWQMIQCHRCQQWFHQGCVGCLKHSILLGDRFYLFVCGVCNSGKEYIRRLPLNWDDIVHLTMFYLTMKDHMKYFDLNEVLVPCLEKNWERLQLPQELDCSANQGKVDHIRARCLSTMQGNLRKYKNGKEIKKRHTWWGLRRRFPPVPPPVGALGSGPVSDSMVDDSLLRGSNMKRANIAGNDQVPLRWFAQKKKGLSTKRKASDNDPNILNAKKRKTSIGSKTTSITAKVESVNQEYEGHAGSSNNYAHPTGVSIPPTTNTDSPAKISLDHVIPCPSNFYGVNHPFKTILERDEELEHVKMKERILHSYSTCNGVLPAKVAESPSDSCNDSQVETESDSLSLTPSESNITVLLPAKKKSRLLNLRHLLKFKRRKRGRPSKAEIQALEARVIAAQKMGITDSNYIVQSCPSTSNTPKAERKTRAKNVVDKNTLDGMSEKEVSMTQLQSSVNDYFGATSRIATGEGFKVLARRITPSGKYQYLVEWEGGIVG